MCGLLACAGCSFPSKPEAPSYEIEIDIPVAEEVVTMQDVVAGREDFLSVDPTGGVRIAITQEIQPFTVGDNLALAVPAANLDVPVPNAGASIGASLSLSLPEGIRVASATVGTGEFAVGLANGSGRGLDVWVTLPDFSSQGSPLLGRISMDALSSVTLRIPLDGSSFAPASPDSVRLEIQALAGTGSSSGVLSLSVMPGSVLLDQVSGDFSGLFIPVTASIQDIAFPQGAYGVTLTEAEVEIGILNGIAASTELDLTVVGSRADGQTVSLQVPEGQRVIAPGSPALPVASTVHFDQGNSTVLDFLNLVPTTIEVVGGVRISDSGVDVGRSDGMDLDVTFRAPLDLVLEETSFLSNAADVGVEDDDTRDRLTTHVSGATITLDMTNHLPVGLEVRLLLGSSLDLTEANAALLVPSEDPVVLPAGAVDPATGLVQTATTPDPAVIVLSAEDVAVFAGLPLYSRVRVGVPGTAGQRVRIVESDFARVSMRARIRMRVDENLVD